MDLTQLSQLPIAVLAMLGAYWAIQRNDAAYQKKLIELIGQFTEKYTALIDRAAEEREEARQRWTERDRQLIALIIDIKDSMNRGMSEVKEALQNDANQNHALRSALQPFVLWWQAERRAQPRPSGDNNDATS